MDKVMDSGSIDAGSIPVRGAKIKAPSIIYLMVLLLMEHNEVLLQGESKWKKLLKNWFFFTIKWLSIR